MFRRLTAAGLEWDFDALTWFSRSQDIAEEFIIERLDLLAPGERIWVYDHLAGLFRKSFKRLLESRLQAERDSVCIEALLKLRERYSDPLKWPYRERSRADRLLETEENLRSNIPILRYAAAVEFYELTRKSEKVVPALLAILLDRTVGDELRKSAAKFLGKVSALDQETIQRLQAIATDPNDPVQVTTKEALGRQKGILKRAAAALRKTFPRQEKEEKGKTITWFSFC
jgi:hypothetical protein